MNATSFAPTGERVPYEGNIRPLTAKPSPCDLSIEAPVQPPVPAGRQSRGVLQARQHDSRMGPAEVFEDPIVLKVELLQHQHLGLGLGWLISVIDPELLPPFGQHRLLILYPSIMEHPGVG